MLVMIFVLTVSPNAALSPTRLKHLKHQSPISSLMLGVAPDLAEVGLHAWFDLTLVDHNALAEMDLLPRKTALREKRPK